jgi:hypothetical protein
MRRLRQWCITAVIAATAGSINIGIIGIIITTKDHFWGTRRLGAL